ncbi:MAG: hypothetical protein KAI17_07475, partial [Thiotrichaceae bacterium]|nr:hypothetical protein [Thiotrichaceae bacterium]
MRFIKTSLFLIFSFALAIALNYGFSYYKEYKNFNMSAAKPPSADQLKAVMAIKSKTLSSTAAIKEEQHISKSNTVLGINTADVREDTSSVQFLNLFKSSIPFNETIPWGSSKDVEYDKNGWPTNLNGGQAGTKFLNR